MAVNPQTGANCTFLSSDQAKLAARSNAGAMSDTLLQATGSFSAGWFVDVENAGPGTETITPPFPTFVSTRKRGF
jgi:hypothetical protein